VFFPIPQLLLPVLVIHQRQQQIELLSLSLIGENDEIKLRLLLVSGSHARGFSAWVFKSRFKVGVRCTFL
jgi:hypothetical protein